MNTDPDKPIFSPPKLDEGMREGKAPDGKHRDLITDSTPEYTVVQVIEGVSPKLMPIRTDMIEEAEGYIVWIKERDKRIKEKAEKQKEVMDRGNIPSSNHEYMMWFRGTRGLDADGPLMHAEYYIAKRYVTKWERV